MRVILELEKLGYRFHLKSEDGVVMGLAYTHPGDLPPAATVAPLFDALKARKWPAVDFLQQRFVQLWIEAMERWEADDNPANDTSHLRELADLAIAGCLPFYDCTQNFRDTGALGWNRFAESYGRHEEVMPMRVEQSRPLPWN